MCLLLCGSCNFTGTKVSSVVAYAHNPCYLGGLGRRISVWGKQKLDNENLSQKNVFSEFLLPYFIYYLIL